MEQRLFLGVDVGGTRLKIALINSERQILKQFNTSSQAHLGAENLLQSIVEVVEDIHKDYGSRLSGLGLSLSGVIEPDFGVVYLPGKFKMLEGFPLVSKLKQRFDIPVTADNDGRLAAYTEKYIGDAKNYDWAVILTVGTGIGSGVILDGNILTNRFLQFGTQIGHFIADASSDTYCLTKNYGTSETQCSATALSLQVKSALQRGIDSTLSDLYHTDPHQITFEKVMEAFRLGDHICVREVNIWIEQLSNLVVNAVHAYSPEVVILSGGATLAQDVFLSKLQALVSNKIFRYPKDQEMAIKISSNQEYSGALGASLKIMHTLENF